MSSLARRGLRATGRLWRDATGAAMVQFIAVLPVFGLIVIGLWAFFSVYSARDALCEATQETARILQVEGRFFPEGTIYPDDWIVEAAKIMESELKSHQWHELTPVQPNEVSIFPESPRTWPNDMSEVTADAVPRSWFFVRATKAITNPVAFLLPDSAGRRTISLSCQKVAYVEGPPIGPTAGPPRPPRNPCPPVAPCPPGGPPPTSTPCPIGQTCPPTPCPSCG